MPSPFPGRNPYFGQSAHWLDFHTEFLTALRRLLAPQVGPKYIVQLEEHIYIHDLPPEPRQRLGRADLSLVQPGPGEPAQANLRLLIAPTEIRLPDQDVEEVPYLEVRDRQGRELITVIELLSPASKCSVDNRGQYLAKRRELLRSSVHLVEIDLLRGWTPMPQEGRPECAYSVMVSRAENRPAADFWPIGLRNRLPVIPVPLRPPDAAAGVDLQESLHRAYDGPGYEHFIYSGYPEPPLAPDDAAWARQLALANA
jgi:hypothetical protein